MKRTPCDEEAKVRYEEFLAKARPDSIERGLLRRERELAESYKDQTAFDRLIDEYVVFRAKSMEYFWDNRGFLDYIFRSFKVWLVSFNESRRYAVEQAVKFRFHKSVDLDNLPAVIVSSTGPDGANAAKDEFLDFIQRYKGPTGREPDVQPGEIVLAITPSWIDSIN